MGEESATGTELRLLHDLKRYAEAEGLACRVIQKARASSPILMVVNPDVRQLSEAITCQQLEGIWWFVWSWGSPIAHAGDKTYAVVAMRRVLGLNV